MYVEGPERIRRLFGAHNRIDGALKTVCESSIRLSIGDRFGKCPRPLHY